MVTNRTTNRRTLLAAALAAPLLVVGRSASAMPVPTPNDTTGYPDLTNFTGPQAKTLLQPATAANPLATATETATGTGAFTSTTSSDGAWTVTGTLGGVDIQASVKAAQAAGNGKIPDSALVTIRNIRLRADAAAMFGKLNTAYKARFGRDLLMAQGYRDYADQVKMKALWTARGTPGNAATPGTSNHGLGLSVDFAGPESHYDTTEHDWLVASGPAFGWLWPCTMRPGGSGAQESWHFDFQGPGLSLLGGGCSAVRATAAGDQ